MKANLVLLSNAVFTGDGKPPFAGGVAICGQRIAAVGTEKELMPWIDDTTQIHRYEDNLIMPGIIEAHGHYSYGAFFGSEYFLNNLFDSHTEEECANMVKEFAQAHPELKRIVGQGWFPASWNDAPLPTKLSLDAVVPDRPVYLAAADGHTGWLNSAALKELEYDKISDQFGDKAMRLPNGELSGVMREEAWCLGGSRVTMPGHDIDEAVNTRLMHELNKVGITCFCDLSGPVECVNYDALDRMSKEGKLSLRVKIYPRISTDPKQAEYFRLKDRVNSEMLCAAGVKGLVDGVTSTFTGYLLEPYSDRPDTCGSAYGDSEYFEDCVVYANQNGIDVRLHCIGDAAVRLALDCFEKSNIVNNNSHIHNAIEHIETIHPDDIPRFAKLGVVASMQPRHVPLDINEKIARVGMERCKWEWPFRSFLDNGAVLAFGTDYPIVSYNPFESIYYAVTRYGFDNKPTGVNPWEKVSIAESLKAYTWGGAYACNCEDEIGTLAAGKLADVIVLDRDLFKIEQDEISDTKVLLTVLGGKKIC